MEADWEFEVGGDATVPEAPIIDACWSGFVDLQRAPERARLLPEASQFPALADALVKLNGVGSPVWTSKCDFWPHLEVDEFDPDEMDAPPGSAAHAMGCYIDLLPRNDGQWLQPAMAEASCRRVCGFLRSVPLGCCRVDLIVRRASITPNPTASEIMSLGITAYLTACGASTAMAEQTLRNASAAFADVLCGRSTLE